MKELGSFLFIAALGFASAALIYKTHMKNSTEFGKGYVFVMILTFLGGAFLSNTMLHIQFPEYFYFGLLSLIIGGSAEAIWLAALDAVNFFKEKGGGGNELF